MDADLEKRYVVEILDADSLAANVFFLPHHSLTNENKFGMVGRFASASSTFQGQSLNSKLPKGLRSAQQLNSCHRKVL